MVIAPLLAAGCLAAIIAGIVRGQLRGAVAGAVEILGREPGHNEITAGMTHAVSLADSSREPTAEIIEPLGAGGVADEALAIAVYCAMVFENDFRRAVLLAVNHGGDSGSTGAITGNMMGALLGVDAFPETWIEHVELSEEIEVIAEDLHERYRDDADWWRRYPGG